MNVYLSIPHFALIWKLATYMKNVQVLINVKFFSIVWKKGAFGLPWLMGVVIRAHTIRKGQEIA